MSARVFVSSVVEGYEDQRAAARRGIEAAGLEPLLVNEDFPALARSPRNACLDAVATCDALVMILGGRAGYETPSGRTVVEEEYDEALRRNLPILVCLEEGVEREARQETFINEVSGYVDGRYRTSFDGLAELQAAVQRATEQLELGVNEDRGRAEAVVSALLQRNLLPERQRPTLRTAFAPVRDEEVVEPGDLESVGRSILDLGHRADVALLSYHSAYRSEVMGDAVRVLPAERAGSGEPHSHAGIELSEAGHLLIETNVMDLVRRERKALGLAIAIEDVEQQLRRSFALAAVLFHEVDKFERQHTVVYNSGLFNLQYQTLVHAADLGHTTRMRMSGDAEVLAHSAPRELSRRTMEAPDDEVERTMIRFRRALEQ